MGAIFQVHCYTVRVGSLLALVWSTHEADGPILLGDLQVSGIPLRRRLFSGPVPTRHHRNRGARCESQEISRLLGRLRLARNLVNGFWS